MSATLLEAPRRSVAPPRANPPSPGAEKPRPRPGRKVVVIAFAISALIHIVVFSIRFSIERTGSVASAAPRVINLPPAPGMRVLDIVGVQADVPTPQVTAAEPTPAAPALTATEPGATVQAPAVAPQVVPGGVAADPARTVTERIIPRSGGDPRLWARAPDPLRPELDPLNNVRARVYSSIQAYNDSMAAAAAGAAAGLDWTVRDKNGGRWGVSPSGIHLGTITLPLPALGTSAEQRETMRQWGEIQQQAGRAQVEETFDDRVRAIRARKEAARDSARRGGGGN